MTKLNFILSLHDRLTGLPQSDIEEHLNFYAEMIEDRIEEGFSEEDAVLAVGSIDEIAAQIMAGVSSSENAKGEIKQKRHWNAWEIVLLVLGSPIWLSLLIVAVAVVFALYVSLWSVIISLWAVFASLAACSIGGVLACSIFAAGGNGASGVAMLASGIVCAGLSIFMFYGCKAATNGTLILTKKMAKRVKNCFVKREEAQ